MAPARHRDPRVVTVRLPRPRPGRGRLLRGVAMVAVAASFAAGVPAAPEEPGGPHALPGQGSGETLAGQPSPGESGGPVQRGGTDDAVVENWADAIAAAGAAGAAGGGFRFSLVGATTSLTGTSDGRHQVAPGGVPAVTLRAYLAAAATMAREDPGCRLGWPLLAGIGHVESRHGTFRHSFPGTDGTVVPPIIGIPLDGVGVARIGDSDGGRWDGDTSYDRAVGPMQFIPGTWRAFGADGDGNGVEDPQNVFDASLAAARYLCAGPGDLSSGDDLRRAVLRYNRSASYADHVLGLAFAYATGDVALQTASPAGSSAGTPSRPPVDPGAQRETIAAMTAARVLPPSRPAATKTPTTGQSTTGQPTGTPTGTSTTGTPTSGTSTTAPPTTGTSTTAPTTSPPTTTDPTSPPATTAEPTCTPPPTTTTTPPGDVVPTEPPPPPIEPTVTPTECPAPTTCPVVLPPDPVETTPTCTPSPSTTIPGPPPVAVP